MPDISSMRNDYQKKSLRREDLKDSPIHQFESWFNEAIEYQCLEPNAFTLATVAKDLKPTQRIVLLKMYDQDGFIFFTNYTSKKAQQIEQNNQVSAHFAWLELERQVSIEGEVEKISKAASMKYFFSRPKGSQIGAWVSHQSKVVNTKSLLESKFNQLKNKFANGEIPFPDFWGGFIIKPTFFEFWQGGHNRLHDRFTYTLQDDNSWQIDRLEP